MKTTKIVSGVALTLLGAGGGYVQMDTAEMRNYRNELVEKGTLTAEETLNLYRIRDQQFGIVDKKPVNLDFVSVREYTRNKNELLNDNKVRPDEFRMAGEYLAEELKNKTFTNVNGNLLEKILK